MGFWSLGRMSAGRQSRGKARAAYYCSLKMNENGRNAELGESEDGKQGGRGGSSRRGLAMANETATLTGFWCQDCMEHTQEDGKAKKGRGCKSKREEGLASMCSVCLVRLRTRFRQRRPRVFWGLICAQSGERVHTKRGMQKQGDGERRSGSIDVGEQKKQSPKRLKRGQYGVTG